MAADYMMDDIVSRKLDIYDGICQQMCALGEEQKADQAWAQYWEALRYFVSGNLTKLELDAVVLETLGENQVHLHNHLILSIIHNSTVELGESPTEGHSVNIAKDTPLDMAETNIVRTNITDLSQPEAYQEEIEGCSGDSDNESDSESDDLSLLNEFSDIFGSKGRAYELGDEETQKLKRRRICDSLPHTSSVVSQGVMAPVLTRLPGMQVVSPLITEVVNHRCPPEGVKSVTPEVNGYITVALKQHLTRIVESAIKERLKQVSEEIGDSVPPVNSTTYMNGMCQSLSSLDRVVLTASDLVRGMESMDLSFVRKLESSEKVNSTTSFPDNQDNDDNALEGATIPAANTVLKKVTNEVKLGKKGQSLLPTLTPWLLQTTKWVGSYTHDDQVLRRSQRWSTLELERRAHRKAIAATPAPNSNQSKPAAAPKESKSSKANKAPKAPKASKSSSSKTSRKITKTASSSSLNDKDLSQGLTPMSRSGSIDSISSHGIMEGSQPRWIPHAATSQDSFSIDIATQASQQFHRLQQHQLQQQQQQQQQLHAQAHIQKQQQQPSHNQGVMPNQSIPRSSNQTSSWPRHNFFNGLSSLDPASSSNLSTEKGDGAEGFKLMSSRSEEMTQPQLRVQTHTGRMLSDQSPLLGDQAKMASSRSDPSLSLLSQTQPHSPSISGLSNLQQQQLRQQFMRQNASSGSSSLPNHHPMGQHSAMSVGQSGSQVKPSSLSQSSHLSEHRPSQLKLQTQQTQQLNQSLQHHALLRQPPSPSIQQFQQFQQLQVSSNQQLLPQTLRQAQFQKQQSFQLKPQQSLPQHKSSPQHQPQKQQQSSHQGQLPPGRTQSSQSPQAQAQSQSQSHAQAQSQSQSHAQAQSQSQSHAQAQSQSQSHAQAQSQSQSQSHAQAQAQAQSQSQSQSHAQAQAQAQQQYRQQQQQQQQQPQPQLQPQRQQQQQQPQHQQQQQQQHSQHQSQPQPQPQQQQQQQLR